MLTIFQLAFLFGGAGTSGSIVEEEYPASQDTIETVPTASRVRLLLLAGPSTAALALRVPQEVQSPVVESQDTIEAVVEDSSSYRVPDVEFEAPAPDLGLFDDVEMMPPPSEVESQDTIEGAVKRVEGVVPSSIEETELERELRLTDEFEERERARDRAQLEDLLEAQRLHREELELRRARRTRRGRAQERSEPREVESQDTIETVPAPVSSAGDLQDLPCEDSVNGRTGRLRYGLPAPVVNPVSCEQCTARRVVCKGHPGRGCFFCIAMRRCACSLATQGSAKRKRGDAGDDTSRSKRPKRSKKSTGRGTEEVRSSPVRESRLQRQQQQQQQHLPGPRLSRPVVLINRVPRVPRTAPIVEDERSPSPQQQQQQQSPPPSSPSVVSVIIDITSSESSPARDIDVPGSSRFPGSFEDTGGLQPADEAVDELGAALQDLTNDVATLRDAGIALVEFADDLAAHLAVLRNRLDERLDWLEASAKGKGKARE